MTFVMGGNSRAGSRCGPVSHSTLQEVSDHATSSHVTPEFPISAASMWDKTPNGLPFYRKTMVFLSFTTNSRYIGLKIYTIPFEISLYSAVEIRG